MNNLIRTIIYLGGVFAVNVGCAIGDNAANVQDGKHFGIIYITNSTSEDLYLKSDNHPNQSGYSNLNCIYPVPKDKQIVPSPSFETISINQRYYQAALIKSGTSVMYTFNSRCDSDTNKSNNESFSLIYASSIKDTPKDAIAFLFMHIDKQKNELEYTKAISPDYAIYGNIVAPNFGVKPWHLTVLTTR